LYQELTNIEISENKEASNLISGPTDPHVAQSIERVLARIKSGDAKLTLSAEQSYQAFLGYYRGHMKRTTIRTKDDLVDTANSLARIMGLKEQPGLTKKAIGKMGLKGIKNLKIISEADVKAKKAGR
jgi:ATP-dependent RNA helicase MSS116